VAEVSAGSVHTCALTTAGSVKCWGNILFSVFGADPTVPRTWNRLPVDVEGLTSDVTAISAGASHTCAVTSAGGVKCWGSNNSMQLGN